MDRQKIYKTKYDDNLRQISSLNWLPWIGENFEIQKTKLLVIGESHYANGVQEEKYNSKQFTRIIHKETAVLRNYYNIKVYANFHRAMFGNDIFDALNFWQTASYYNFIQRPMLSKTARPTTDDYQKAWQTFIEISKILEPDICIFLGTKSADYFNKIMATNNIIHQKVSWQKKIGNSYPKIAEINKKTKLIFIRHPSQYFSWQKWNKFLSNEIPEYFN